MLAIMLANRLSYIIGKYVAGDQTRFIRGRYLKENIRKVRNIINKAPRVLLFLDAKKAFEMIE